MEHVFLTAVTVEGPTREAAELHLHKILPQPIGGVRDGESCFLESWWIAEDDRRDRSDNDSAIFVPMGQQEEARDALSSIPARTFVIFDRKTKAKVAQTSSQVYAEAICLAMAAQGESLDWN